MERVIVEVTLEEGEVEISTNGTTSDRFGVDELREEEVLLDGEVALVDSVVGLETPSTFRFLVLSLLELLRMRGLFLESAIINRIIVIESPTDKPTNRQR